MNIQPTNTQTPFQAKLRIGDTIGMLKLTQKEYLTEYAHKIGSPSDTIDMAFAIINGVSTLFLQSSINGVENSVTYKNLGDYPVIAGCKALYDLEKNHLL